MWHNTPRPHLTVCVSFLVIHSLESGYFFSHRSTIAFHGKKKYQIEFRAPLRFTKCILCMITKCFIAAPTLLFSVDTWSFNSLGCCTRHCFSLCVSLVWHTLMSKMKGISWNLVLWCVHAFIFYNDTPFFWERFKPTSQTQRSHVVKTMNMIT